MVRQSMSYDQRPVLELLQGPLLHSPQGWVVLASILLYGGIAGLGWVLGVSPLIAKSSSTFFVFCAAWPFITFLYFVRGSAPHFAPSIARTVELAITALLPIAFSAWRAYV